VNVPPSRKTLTTKQYHLTAKQRLITIASIGIMAIIITFYVTTSEVAVEPAPLPINNTQQTAKIVLPPGNEMIPVNQIEQTMRDPFAKPPDPNEQKNDAERVVPVMQNNPPSAIPITDITEPTKIVPSRPNLKLTGIVGNAEGRLAVISSANKSQSYGVNEMIGTYRIVAIHADSVILTNATGKLVLSL